MTFNFICTLDDDADETMSSGGHIWIIAAHNHGIGREDKSNKLEYTGTDCKVQKVMDGLDINRDDRYGDCKNLNDDTRKLIFKLEKSQYSMATRIANDEREYCRVLIELIPCTTVYVVNK